MAYICSHSKCIVAVQIKNTFFSNMNFSSKLQEYSSFREFDLLFAVHSIHFVKQWIYCEHLAFSITCIDIQFTAHLLSICMRFNYKQKQKKISNAFTDFTSNRAKQLFAKEQCNPPTKNLFVVFSICYSLPFPRFIFIFNLVQFVWASVGRASFVNDFLIGFLKISHCHRFA